MHSRVPNLAEKRFQISIIQIIQARNKSNGGNTKTDFLSNIIVISSIVKSICPCFCLYILNKEWGANKLIKILIINNESKMTWENGEPIIRSNLHGSNFILPPANLCQRIFVSSLTQRECRLLGRSGTHQFIYYSPKVSVLIGLIYFEI